MNIPENLKYTKDHEWVQINDNIATDYSNTYSDNVFKESN